MGSVLLRLPARSFHSFPGRSPGANGSPGRVPGVPLVAFDHGNVGARLVGDRQGSLVGDGDRAELES